MRFVQGHILIQQQHLARTISFHSVQCNLNWADLLIDSQNHKYPPSGPPFQMLEHLLGKAANGKLQFRVENRVSLKGWGLEY